MTPSGLPLAPESHCPRKEFLAKALSLSTENTFHGKNFIAILVNWTRRLENCRDSMHMHNYQKKRNIEKYKF